MRRLLLLVLMMVAGLVAGTLPASAAPGGFGADQIVVNCTAGSVQASIAPDGTTRGFASCYTWTTRAARSTTSGPGRERRSCGSSRRGPAAWQ